MGLGLVLVAASAEAERHWRLPRSMPSYGIVLEASDGAVLPTFRHEGRTFVLGERGERYAVRVDNPTGERVEAVLSVDGRDAISGGVGNYRNQRGYVIPPYGSVRIEGFRRSLDEVAAFRFSTPAESYSARRGTPENVGVIGVAVFREKPRPIARPEPRPFPRRGPSEDEARTPAPARAAPKSEAKRPAARSSGRSLDDDVDNLGTEYGETRESSVVEVPFMRRSNAPDRLLTVRYDDADGLERRGIDLSPLYDYSRPHEPEPFPQSRFAPPP